MRQLRFRNNSETYELNNNWKFDLSSFDRRLDLSSRYSKNGSNVYGDRTTDARKMVFRYQLPTETDQENIQFISDLENFFDIVNFPYFLEDIGNGRRARIEIDRIEMSSQSEGLRKRLETVTLGVVMLDGEWEDLTENVQVANLSSGGTMTVINNTRTVYAIVQIKSQGSILDFDLFNTSNSSGVSMSLTSFQPDEIIILDGLNGTITKDGVDQSFNVVEGGLISLQTGANTIQYGSATGSVEVTVKWRNVYAY
jgi:phage-related protein